MLILLRLSETIYVTMKSEKPAPLFHKNKLLCKKFQLAPTNVYIDELFVVE